MKPRNPPAHSELRRALPFTVVSILAASVLLPIAIASPAAATVQADSREEEGSNEVWGSLATVDASSLGLVGNDEVQGFTMNVEAMSAALLGPDPARSFRTFATDMQPTNPTTRTLTIPNPDGVLVDFVVRESSVMEERLAADHPEIRTFEGHAVENTSVTVRAGMTPLGFSASVRSGDNSTQAWYVDPVEVGDTATYAAYGRSAARDTTGAGAAHEEEVEIPEGLIKNEPSAQPGASRTIRAAMLNDIRYANFFGTENVLAAKVTTMNRVAQIYNDDLAVRLVLVNDTEKLNIDTATKAFEPNGPCGADPCMPPWALDTCNSNALDGGAATIQKIIGDANYDVGHLMMGGVGGGLGGMSVVGVDYWKGWGCTSVERPVGDVFAVDYVAHELGHQFGGDHTFTACQYSVAEAAVEPGSGSTIMGYAGICGGNNLQSNTDPYFSSVSIDQIQSRTGWVGVVHPTENTIPRVTAPEPKTIPVRTPFALTATGSDADGDVLTYMWEQRNTGDFGRNLFDSNKTDGPLFRVFSKAADLSDEQAHSYYSGGQNSATASGTRVFPDLAQIVAGQTNAKTGDCDAAWGWFGQRDCYSEFLPTAAYEGNGTGGMNFRVTARDHNSDGAALAKADVHIGVDRTAGPLEVTSFADATELILAGEPHEVTWAVNGTDKAQLAPFVRVTLSADGGVTFPTVLAESTPNDGSETISMPDIETEKARIKIEAVDNYFFAVSSADVTIAHTDSALAQAVILSGKEKLRADEMVLDSLTSFDNGAIEAEKNLRSLNSGVGSHNGNSYRDAQKTSDSFFQYELMVDPTLEKNYLGVRYFGGDDGRTFDVYVNDVLLKNERVTNAAGADSFYTQYDEIPTSIIAGIEAADSYKKDASGAYVLDERGAKIPVVTVRFQSNGVSYVGGIYGLHTAPSTSYDARSDLKAFSLAGGSLSPHLSDGVYEYAASVAAGSNSVTVEVDPAIASGLVYVDNVLIDDTRPRSVELADGGVTTLSLRSTAQDHTTSSTYSIVITVEKPSPNPTPNPDPTPTSAPTATPNATPNAIPSATPTEPVTVAAHGRGAGTAAHLAMTGAEGNLFAVAGFLLLGAGAVMLGAARRRRRSS